MKSSCPPILSTLGLRTRKLVIILLISLSAHGSFLSTVWRCYLHYQSFDISYLRCLFPPIENNGCGSAFNSSLVFKGPMCIFYVTIFCDFWYYHSFENCWTPEFYSLRYSIMFWLSVAGFSMQRVSETDIICLWVTYLFIYFYSII